jgi:hypothetical protein
MCLRDGRRSGLQIGFARCCGTHPRSTKRKLIIVRHACAQRDIPVLSLSLHCNPTDASRPLNRSNADQLSCSVTSRCSDNFPSLLHSTPRLQHREICLRGLVLGLGVGCATTWGIVAVSTRSLQLDPSTLSHGTALLGSRYCACSADLHALPFVESCFLEGGVWGCVCSGGDVGMNGGIQMPRTNCEEAEG